MFLSPICIHVFGFWGNLGSPIPLRRLPGVVPVGRQKGPGASQIGEGSQRGSQRVPRRLCFIFFRGILKLLISLARQSPRCQNTPTDRA